MKNEFENVQHLRVNSLQFLINDLTYRQPHLHFDTELAYVMSGKGLVKTLQTTFSFNEGDFIIFNSCQVHEFISEKSMRLLIMQLPMTDFTKIYPALEAVTFESQPCKIDSSSNLLSHLIKAAMAYFEDREYLPILSSGYTLLTLFDLLETVNHEFLNNSQQNKLFDMQNRIQRITSTIQSNFDDNISMQDLATQEGFTPTYFSHFFKKNFGMTYQEYLDNLRCERGRYLLLTTNENLLNITTLIGFSDVRTFNRAFIKRYGSSPKDYRKGESNKPSFTNDFSSDDNQVILSYPDSLEVLNEYFDSFLK